jgi:SnoaL-like domain
MSVQYDQHQRKKALTLGIGFDGKMKACDYAKSPIPYFKDRRATYPFHAKVNPAQVLPTSTQNTIMDHYALKAAATRWVEDWNSRDLDRIMEHYAENVEFESPSVVTRWGYPDGKLRGKIALRVHFKKGLDLPPDSPFELVDILAGIDSFLVVYKQAGGNIVADYVVTDKDHKALIIKVFAPTH